MTKKKTLFSTLLAILMMVFAMFSFVACNKGDGNRQGNEQGSGSNPADETVNTNGITAQMVVNQSLDKMEQTFGSISSTNSQIAALTIPNPYANNYKTKADALRNLYDIYQGQYMAQYFTNYVNTASGYLADYQFGKIYSTTYMMNGFFAYIRILQQNSGINFRLEIPVTFNGMSVKYQYDFNFNYDYETKKPKSMTLYLTQYNKQEGEHSVEDVGAYLADINFETNAVNYLKLITDCNDAGNDFYGKLNNNQFDAATFEASSVKAYYVEQVSLDSTNNDFFVYNYGEGSSSGAGSVQTEIDDTFRTRYNDVYNAVKNNMHTREFLDITTAENIGADLYNNMYEYSQLVLDTMSTNSGNLRIMAIKKLADIKTFCAQLKTQLETDDEYIGSTKTYNIAKQTLANAIEYLSTIDQAHWFGLLDAEGKVELNYYDDASVYQINYAESHGLGIYFIIDSNGNAKLHKSQTEDGAPIETAPDSQV